MYWVILRYQSERRLVWCDECDGMWVPEQIIRARRFQFLSSFLAARHMHPVQSFDVIEPYTGPAAVYGDPYNAARDTLPHPIERPDLDPLMIRPCPCCDSGLLCCVHLFDMDRHVVICDVCDHVWEASQQVGPATGTAYEQYLEVADMGQKEFIEYLMKENA